MTRPMATLTDPTTGEKIAFELHLEELGAKRIEIQSKAGNTFYVNCEFGMKPQGPLYQDKEWLIEHYVKRGSTMVELSSMFGVTPMTIHLWLKKHNIPSRPRGRRQANL